MISKTLDWFEIGEHQRTAIAEKLRAMRGSEPTLDELKKYFEQRQAKVKGVIMVNQLKDALWLSTPMFRTLVTCRGYSGFEILHFVETFVDHSLRDHFVGMIRKRSRLKSLTPQPPGAALQIQYYKFCLNSSYGYFKLQTALFSVTKVWSEDRLVRALRSQLSAMEKAVRECRGGFDVMDEELISDRRDLRQRRNFREMMKPAVLSPEHKEMWIRAYDRSLAVFRQWRRAQFLGMFGHFFYPTAANSHDCHPLQGLSKVRRLGVENAVLLCKLSFCVMDVLAL